MRAPLGGRKPRARRQVKTSVGRPNLALKSCVFWRFVLNSHDELKYLARQAAKAMSPAAWLLAFYATGLSKANIGPGLAGFHERPLQGLEQPGGD